MEIKSVSQHSTDSPGAPIPTAIPMLDDALGGGMMPGEVYGIHSFTGGGATTLGCMVAAEAALAEWKNAYPGPFKRRWCVVVNGQSAVEVQGCLFSYLAGVPSDSVAECWKSTTSLPPEKLAATVDHAAQYGTLDERGRCAQAQAVLDKSLVVMDGFGISLEHYWNPTDRLERTIAKALAPAGELAGLFVDGLELFVEDYRRVSRQPEKAMPRLYRKFLADCRTIFGEKHGCPAWVTHRLRAALANSPPDAVLTHRDVAECKRLGEEMDACFTLGNRDAEGRFLLRCTKTPRADKPQPRVVRFAPSGVRKIIEDPAAGVELSSHRSWRSMSPVNVDDRALREIHRLAGEIEQDQGVYRQRQHRQILVRADD